MTTTGTSPLKLPTELWSRIFIDAVKDELKTLSALQAVNQAFHSITDRTPRLWTRLFIRIRSGQIDLPRTRALLRKSGILPLEIRIFINEDADGKSLAKLLRTQVSRIKALDLIVPSPGVAETILYRMGRAKPAPILERLRIYNTTDDDEYYDGGFALTNIFDPSPRFTQIRLPADLVPSLLSLDLLELDSMTIADTSASIFNVSVEEIVDFVCSKPILGQFTFIGMDAGLTGFLWPLESLCELVPCLLSVDVTVPGRGMEILYHLDMPSLKRMRLDGRRSFYHEWDPGLAASLGGGLRRISRASPQTTRLELVMTMFPDRGETYARIFSGAMFPNLESLRLEATCIKDAALEKCTTISNRLKRLELWACQGVTGAGLAQFVRMCDGDFELLLDSCRNVTPEDVVDLSKMVKVELECHVFRYNHDDDGYNAWL